MKIVPGDRVVTTGGLSHNEDERIWVIDVTVGCTAVAISFEDYCAYYRSCRLGSYAYSPSLMKERMESGFEYPFRIETVGKTPPLEHDEVNACRVGYVTALRIDGIRLLDEQGRLVQDADTTKFKPGDKVRVLKDVIKRQDYGMALIPAGCEAVIASVELYAMLYHQSENKGNYEYLPNQLQKWVEQDLKYPVSVYPNAQVISPNGLVWLRGGSTVILDKIDLQLISSPYREIEGKMR